MSVLVALFLFLCTAYTDDESLSFKLCNRWEFGSDLSMATYLKQFHLTTIGQYISSTNHSHAHNTQWYLPQLLVDYHLSTFRTNGASFIAPIQTLHASNYGRSSFLGYKNQIVTTTPEMHIILEHCGQESNQNQCVLDQLNINTAHSPFINSQQVMVYHINETYLEFLNIRMANDTRNPGGYTPNGVRQAVIDHVPYPMFCWQPITDRNGTFCYPSCEEPLCGQNENCKRSYCSNYVVNTTAHKYKFYFDFIENDKTCVSTTNITMKQPEDTNTKCQSNDKDNWMQKVFNIGSLIGFLFCLLCIVLGGFITQKICGYKCKCVKVEPTFISDQLLRDKDQYLL